MKFTSVTKLKAWIRNKAKEADAPIDVIMRSYMMERFLERISLSEYRENFIIKGGFLIKALVGIDLRMTMDMDATIKGIRINHEVVEKLINNIASIDAGDDITFEILSIKPIRDASECDDFCISLRGWFLKLRQDIKVDITVGDLVLPSEIEQDYPLMFENRSISIMAYNLYSILAEKLDATLTNNIHNTRSRDFYDLYLLTHLNKNKIDCKQLQEITQAKMYDRGNNVYYDNRRIYLKKTFESKKIRDHWTTYANEYNYASEISFDDIIPAIYWLLDET